MKKQALLVSVLLLLGMVVSSAILGGCDYVNGEAFDSPSISQPTTAPKNTSDEATESPETFQPPAGTVKNVTPEEANRLFMLSSKWVHAIDVRTPREYAEGHLLGAVNINYDADFTEQVGRFYKDESYLVYCRSGSRSAAAAQTMIELGFTDVFNMIGGISAWQAAGFQVVK